MEAHAHLIFNIYVLMSNMFVGCRLVFINMFVKPIGQRSRFFGVVEIRTSEPQ